MLITQIWFDIHRFICDHVSTQLKSGTPLQTKYMYLNINYNLCDSYSMRLYSRALKAPLIFLIANCQHNPVNWMQLDLFADSNECSSSPCTPTEQCIDQVDGYLCIEFDKGGVSTHDKMIDHCSYSPCVHGTCSNNLAKNFTCLCEVGFTGPTCAEGMCYQVKLCSCISFKTFQKFHLVSDACSI